MDTIKGPFNSKLFGSKVISKNILRLLVAYFIPYFIISLFNLLYSSYKNITIFTVNKKISN